MGLRLVKDDRVGKLWIDNEDDNFQLNAYWDMGHEKIRYTIRNKERYVFILKEKSIPEEELYERIFLPAKTAILSGHEM